MRVYQEKCRFQVSVQIVTARSLINKVIKFLDTLLTWGPAPPLRGYAARMFPRYRVPYRASLFTFPWIITLTVVFDDLDELRSLMIVLLLTIARIAYFLPARYQT